MKDIISIIFAALVLSFLIVILPLFSILDRQDTMSYNLVLTKTTAFIDEIRANGFITLDAYNEYIASLASTGNTYKVDFETYKTVLLRDDVDTYTEKKELYNTQDIAKFLGNETVNKDVDKSNFKENIYLLNEDDEIYVRVYNTNTTSGSIMYNMLISPKDNKAIDITYGGKVKEINWELYTKLKNETISSPEVFLSLPINERGKINVTKLVDNKDLVDMECFDADLSNLFSGVYELCSDVKKGDIYQYIYDLDQEENKNITFYVELNDVSKINVGRYEEKTIESLRADGLSDEETEYVLENYIVLNGMVVDESDGVEIKASDNSYYDFKITLNNVEMANLSNISVMASLAILPGLGANDRGVPTLGAESVPIQLTHRSEAKTTTILGPYNWKKFLKTKDSITSAIEDGAIYVGEEIFFKVQYTGIKESVYDVREALRYNIEIYEQSGVNESNKINTGISYGYYTPEEMLNDYGVVIETDTVIVKMTYSVPNNSPNYIKLKEGWYAGIPESRSDSYKIYNDIASPLPPTILFDGEQGEDGWYVSNVIVSIAENGDRLNHYVRGGSGIDYSKFSVAGVSYEGNEEVVLTESSKQPYSVTAFSCDYVNQKSETVSASVKIDKGAPNNPTIKINDNTPSDDWYNQDVKITISENGDEISGVSKITYEVSGQKTIAETVGTSLNLTEAGIYTLVANVYDVAGNKASRTEVIKIDKGEPPEIKFEITEGSKHSETNEWYYTNVRLRISIESKGGITNELTNTYNLNGETKAFVGTIQEILLTNEGTHDIVVTSATATGKKNTAQYTVKIDKTLPKEPKVYINNILVTNPDEETTEEITIPEWYTSDVKVRVESAGDDGGSGLKESAYQLISSSGETVENGNGIETNTEFTLSSEGINELQVIIRDNAENERIYSSQIKIDKTPPDVYDINLTDNTGTVTEEKEWYQSDVYVTFGLKENYSELSGLAGYTYKVTNDVTNSEISGNESAINITTEGTNILELSALDNAGNEKIYTKVIKIDKEQPTKPIIELPEANDYTASNEPSLTTKVYTGKININIVPGTDTLSGVNKTTYIVKKYGEQYIEETTGTQINLTESGRYAVIARTYDNAGMYSESSSAFVIELEGAPNVKFEIPETAKGNNGWCKAAVDLFIQVIIENEDTQSPVGEIVGESNVSFLESTTVRFDTNGYHTIKVKTTTIFGAPEEKEFSLKIDATPPNMPTVNISGTTGENGWYTSDVNVETTLNGDDGGSEEQPYSYEVKNAGNIIDSGSDKGTQSVITLSEEGTNDLRIVAKDGAGNETPYTSIIKIDKTAPNMPTVTIDGTEGLNDWYISNVNVTTTLNGDVGGSDIQSYSYEVKNKGVVVDSGSGKATNTTITLTEEGINELKIVAKDGAGNETIYTSTIKIDKTAPKNPTVNINGTEGLNGWYTSDVNVTAVLVDDVQTYSYEVKNNGSVIDSGSNKETNSIIALTTEGRNELTITLKDSAGNETIYTSTIKIDKTAPNYPISSTTGDIGENDWYIGDVDVTTVLTGDSGGSSADNYSYEVVNDGKIIDSGSRKESYSVITLTQNGINRVNITVIDGAGNETIYRIVVKIDKTAPKDPTVTINGTKGSNEWYTSNVELTIAPNEDIGGSELQSYSYEVKNSETVIVSESGKTTNTPITLTEEGINELKIVAKDGAGNETVYTTVIKIDKTAPTYPVINLPQQIEHNMGPTINAYNDDIEVSITAGTDLVSEIQKTTYMVNKDGLTYIAESEGTKFNISESGMYTIIAKTYNNAGKYAEESVAVFIQKEPPKELKVAKINGKATNELEDTTPNINIIVENFVGDYITLTLTGPDGTETKKFTTDNISVTIDTLGTYTIQLTQTNEYLKTSSPVSITYKYITD